MRPTQFSADTIIALLRTRPSPRWPRSWRRSAQRQQAHRVPAQGYRRPHQLLASRRLLHPRRSPTSTSAACGPSPESASPAPHPDRNRRSVRQSRRSRTLRRRVGQSARCRHPGRARKLVADARLTRHKLAGQFRRGRTTAADAPGARQTPAAGHARTRTTPARRRPDARGVTGRLVLFASLLDERQRRLFAGLEALKCGWGGDRRIARLLGIDPSTVAAGRRQLVERDVEVDRVRRAGGGRTPTEKKRRKSLPASKP